MHWDRKHTWKKFLMCREMSEGVQITGLDGLGLHLDGQMRPAGVWVRTLEIKRKQARSKPFETKGVILGWRAKGRNQALEVGMPIEGRCLK